MRCGGPKLAILPPPPPLSSRASMVITALPCTWRAKSTRQRKSPPLLLLLLLSPALLLPHTLRACLLRLPLSYLPTLLRFARFLPPLLLPPNPLLLPQPL